MAEDSKSKHVAAILALDAELSAALNARAIDHWLSHFAPDARIMPPGGPTIEGQSAIRSFINGLLAIPRFLIATRDHAVDVSDDGRLAWMTYLHDLTVWDVGGVTTTETARNLLVFKRQPDGAWKVVADIWNDVGHPAG